MIDQPEKMETAIFAGGCFWCMQPAFDQTAGVIKTRVGYTGGTKENPTYEEVSGGQTGHYEAIEIVFDPTRIDFGKLLDIFWRNIDPTQTDGQFADRGSQYRTAIFFHGAKQKAEAEKSKSELEKMKIFGRPIATQILPATVFYPAEDDHQNYYLKCPIPYRSYKKGSGRQGFIEKIWGTPAAH